jgi:DNA-binding transcriptional LysR family regulator
LLTAFEAIFHERNLTKAAVRVSMSQPAMSNALSRLRLLLQDQLFVRTGNTMQPTQRAHQLSKPILQALELVREGLNNLSEFDPESNRDFNIAGNEYVNLVLLPKLLPEIYKYIENVHINSVLGDANGMRDKLKSGDIDVVIDINPLRDSEFEMQKIGTDKYVSIARKGHPSEGKKLTQDELLDHDHLILEPLNNDQGFFMEQLLRSNSQEHRIVARTAHLYGLPLMIAETDLVSSVPAQISKVFLKHFDLIELDAVMEQSEFPLMMIWHQSQTSDPGHQWLRNHIEQVCNF